MSAAAAFADETERERTNGAITRARESRAVEARDAKIGSLLRASLDDSLPLALRGVPPRLRSRAT